MPPVLRGARNDSWSPAVSRHSPPPQAQAVEARMHRLCLCQSGADTPAHPSLVPRRPLQLKTELLFPPGSQAWLTPGVNESLILCLLTMMLPPLWRAFQAPRGRIRTALPGHRIPQIRCRIRHSPRHLRGPTIRRMQL